MAITATVTGGLVQLTGNPVFINCEGASIPFGASEYMILLRIISQDGKLEGAPFEVGMSPDATGKCTFNISAYLDAPLPVTFDNYMSAKYMTYPTRAFNIQIQPGERFINSSNQLEENWFAVSSVFQMVKGGLTQRQNAMMKAENKNFYSTYIEGKKFLTPRPDGDLVHPSQPVKLWFMPVESVVANINLKVYYDDLTDTTVSTSVSISADHLNEFNCNPAVHGLQMETSTKKIIYYEFWISSNSTLYSDVRRFNVDWTYCERPYFLFFANSLGGIDDVYLRGYGTDIFNVTNSLAYRPVQPEDTVFTPTIVAPNKSGQNKWKINSGWKSIPTIQFYRDLMLSKQAWFLYSNISMTSQIIIPIIITNADVELVNRMDDQWSIDIEFVEAHTSRFSFDNRMY